MNEPITTIPVLSAKGLHKTFNEASLYLELIRGIDFEIQSGQKHAIVGSSGSGKSTLLHILGGLESPSHGKVFWQGKNLKQFNENQRNILRNKNLGFIYQFHHLLSEFTALENVAMPLRIRNTNILFAQNQARAILESMGLEFRLNHKPSELSGGERQRVAVARALVGRPNCVLADEPTGNLDSKTAQKVFLSMLELAKNLGTAFIIVTHDEKIAKHCDRIFSLNNGILIDKSK